MQKNYIKHIAVVSIILFAKQAISMDKSEEPIMSTFSQTHEKMFLTDFPKELHNNMLINKSHSFTENLKTALAISATCSHFSNNLPYLGQLLQPYDHKTKNDALEKLSSSMDYDYWKKKRAALLLIHAGADPNTPHMLFQATWNRDVLFIAELFKHGANPNLKTRSGEPIFFNARTPAIAQIFVDYGADLNASSFLYPNVLWHTFREGQSLDKDVLEIIKIYIDKNVNSKLIHEKTGECLLHLIANTDNRAISMDSCFISFYYDHVAEYMCTKISHMINLLNKKGKTPLDIASECVIPQKRIIDVFKKYGAKKSQELR